MAELKLAVSVATRNDLVILQHEVDELLEQFVQARIRAQSTSTKRPIALPSQMLQDLLKANQLQLSETSLQRLKAVLGVLRERAPTLRVAFAAEPSKEAITRLAEWFRREISPYLIIQVGVQPSIAGGMVLHTMQHRYDFSFRQKLLSSNPKFIEALNRVK